MVVSTINDPRVLPSDNVLKYFRVVGESSELPPLPAAAGQVLKMVQDPDLNARELCRVLSDDAVGWTHIGGIPRALLRPAHASDDSTGSDYRVGIQDPD